MNFEELDIQLEKDLKFKVEEVDSFIAKIPSLKQKYSKELFKEEIKVKQIEIEMSGLKKQLHEYYLSDYSLKIDRRDVDLYIEGDKKYIEASKILEIHKSTAKYLESALKTIDQLSFTLPAMIKWNIYKSGG